jgi:succinyl-diaminopimelate desuccinylase
MDETVKSVLQEAERRRGDVVTLCSELVKIPSVNPPGVTRDVVDYLHSYFDAVGLPSTIWEPEAGKSNLCVRLPGAKAGTILWLGHLDVVPAGDRRLWHADPFGGAVVGDRVYGRGTSDMKGACASAVIAATILSTLPPEHRCTVEFWFTCDEETGAEYGAKWLSATGKLQGDVCLIGDSSADLPHHPTIDVGCKGYLHAALRASGVTAHGSQPYLGDNAIDKLITAAEAAKRVEDLRLDFPAALEPVIRSTLDGLKAAQPLRPDQLAKLERLFHYPTASLNMIAGGVKINVVPDHAEAELDVRVTPGVDLEAVKHRLITLVEASGVTGVEVAFTSSQGGYYEDPTSPAMTAFIQAVEVATQAPATLKLITGGTDAVHVKAHAAIPCLGFGVGVEGMAHVANEYTTIANLVAGTKVYAVFPLMDTAAGSP